MTVLTTLDENAYYHAIWIQNELYSKRMIFWMRIFLISVVLAITLPMTFVDEKTDWLIRVLFCVLVVGVHAVVSKQARRKMLQNTAHSIQEAHGGDLHMEYRFEEDGFTAVSPEGTQEFSYSKVLALAEDTEVFVISMSKAFAHAIRKADLSLEDRRALATHLYVKTAKVWKAVKL